MNLVSSNESYRFACRRCRHEWGQEYEIRRWVDCDGDEHATYRIGGSPVLAPGRACCPRCGGYRVTVLPHRIGAPDLG